MCRHHGVVRALSAVSVAVVARVRAVRTSDRLRVGVSGHLGDSRQEGVTMSAHDQLKEIPCPQCGECTLYLGEGLRARPIGSFSLAGQQMKFSAVSTPVIRCKTRGCDFVKHPKGSGQ